MRTSIIVNTYNWPSALNLVLASLSRQLRMPHEVIVVDDGSGPATAEVVARWQQRLPCPLLFIWQEDIGFRLARARNLGIAASSGEYIVLIDGDMVLHERFIEDHEACACPGRFIQGKRIRLSKGASERMLATGKLDIRKWRTVWHYGVSAWRNPVLSRLRSRTRPTLESIKGCNQSFWREDLVRANGFDERFGKWGFEDLELAQRLLHLGIQRNYVKHRAIAFHLYHELTPMVSENPNELLFLETVRTGRAACVDGLAPHLADRQLSKPEYATSPGAAS